MAQEFDAQVQLHELSSPLTAVTVFAELTLKNWWVYPDDVKRSKIEKILENSLEARRLLQCLPWAEKVDCNWGNFAAEFWEVLNDVQAIYPFIEITNGVTNDAEVWVDPKALTIIVQHLIDNANRYRLPDTKVLVQPIEDFTPSFPHVGIAVSNNGTTEVVDYHDFTPYVSDGTGTQGLGLHIVKSYTEAMGGSVTVDQKKTDHHVVTTFTIWLKARRIPET